VPGLRRSHDLANRAVRAIQPDSPSNRFLVRPIGLGKLLVHNRHATRSGAVVLRESAPAFDFNIHGAEVSGIHSGADLKAQSLKFLEQNFGRSGTYYYAIARGEDDRRVVPDRPRKSVGSETTFMQDLGRPAEIEEGISSVLEDVWSYCERTGVAGRTVTVKIKYADFQIVTRSRTLPELVSSREELERTSVELVHSIFPLEKKVRLLGVSLSNMGTRAEAPVPEPQLTLGL